MLRRLPRPASYSVLLLRLLQLNVGLLLYGLSLAFMLEADIGLGPWDVFHQGVSLRTPLTIGQAMVLAGLALVVYTSVAARQRPGLGTLLNMLLIGLWVDFFLALPGFPHATGWLQGAGFFALGLVLNGVATGLYITAGLGAGPRDGFALGLSKMLKVSVSRARTGVEVVVFVLGWILGGTVGVGTIAFAVFIGPLMQANLRLFEGLEKRYQRTTEARVAHRSHIRDVASDGPSTP